MVESLADKSNRPHHHPNELSPNYINDFCGITLLLFSHYIFQNISLVIAKIAFLVLYYSLRDKPSSI